MEYIKIIPLRGPPWIGPPLGSCGNVLDALDTLKKTTFFRILTRRRQPDTAFGMFSQTDVIFPDSDPPEAAGHSNWYTLTQKDIILQDSDAPEAAGHSSTSL